MRANHDPPMEFNDGAPQYLTLGPECNGIGAILSCRIAPSQWGNELKIYTKAGDSGETGLFGGSRVRKDVDRVEAYGSLDELNAQLGMVVAGMSGDRAMPDILVLLTRIQSELFDVGAELATPPDRATSKLAERVPVTDALRVAAIETAIDAFDATLEPLRTFILPGGTQTAAALHVARTVARRAERRIVTLARAEPVNPLILQYLNRLSDLFFVLARAANRSAGIADTPWVQGAKAAGDTNPPAV